MFPYPCQKCGRLCRPDLGLQCSNCKKNSNSGAGMYESFDPEQPEIAVPRETGVASGRRIHLDPNNLPLDSTVLVQNGKRNKPNDEIIQNIIQFNTQSRQEICKISEINLDFIQETNTATNGMTSGFRHSVNIHEAFLNNESQWNIPQFQGSQKDNAPVNKGLLNNKCQWNMGQFQFSQKGDAPVKSADSSESVREAVHSGDSTLAVSGPSGFHGKPNVPNVIGEKLKFSNSSEIQSVELTKKPEIFQCKVCGKAIDEHTKILPSENPYFCCVCVYESKTPVSLELHIRIHCPKDDCRVCSKEHTDGSLHDGEQICRFCYKTFHCRTQLHEHLIELHKDNFPPFCWGCSLNICDHFTKKEGKKLYFCCVCGYNTSDRRNLQTHNVMHRLKVFCKICREEYPEEQKSFHNSKFSCINCEKEFKCRTQLEDHCKGDVSCVKHFSNHCRLCNKIINEHVVKRGKNQYFKCCACQEDMEKNMSRYHIYTHLDLGIFKCGNCGKRLQQ